MARHQIGKPVRRKEDYRLLTGAGRYTDDFNFAGQLFVAFLRSPYAHARIGAIDVVEAERAAGVAAIFTGKDLVADRVGTIICEAELKDAAGRAMFKPPRPVFPTDRVRFGGEPIALVIAESYAQARDAAELIMVDYEELPAVVGADAALRADAPLVWPENGSNMAVHWESGDPAPVDAILASSPRRVTVDVINNRVIPSPMEPCVALATHDIERDITTLYTPFQGGRRLQKRLSQFLSIDQEKIRVLAHDTGGGFGIRSSTYPEHFALAWAARKIKRPLKWRSDRSETFISDYHGRDQINHAEMALDSDGRILALKVETLLNLGAYLSENGPRLPMAGGGRIIPCAYDITSFYFSAKPVLTNTVPTETYRGAGRPEANFLMERLMDSAAVACGLTRDEIRRRNLIPPEKLPYTTQMGLVIDSGDFVGTMDLALKAANWRGFEERRGDSAAHGKMRGIGIASFIAGAGGQPIEEMRVRIAEDGAVSVTAGTYSHGQGHETVYAQLVADFLGVSPDDVTLVQGDTDTMPARAVGTFGSRSSMMGGAGIKRACDQVVAKGKVIAGYLLQAPPSQIAFADGVFKASAGSVTLAEVAAAANSADKRPDGVAPGLDELCTLQQDAMNYPNGCHICEVDVDPETGAIEILNYVAVDDCGVVLNPLIVHGQVHGGVAQGLGQSLCENLVYDPDTGQLLTGSYMDYGMIRAGDISRIQVLMNEVPCATNDLGVKGVGEAGACGAPHALVSAVIDALRPLGVSHLNMPLTPQRVWSAIQDSKSNRSGN